MNNFLDDLLQKLPPHLCVSISKCEGQSHAISQIHDIGAAILLSQNDYNKVQEIRNHIQCISRHLYPDCTVYLFGSCATGLGFQGSDVDLVASVDTTREGNGNPKESIIWNLSRRIGKNWKYCNVITIPKARIPLIKFVDQQSKFSIDLTCKNTLAYYNSLMIKTYVFSHPLVRPFLVFLKLWGKSVGVTGSAKPQVLITSYAFILMGLFVLMNRDDPIIPPFEDLLQKGLKTTHVVYVNSWLCSFDKNLRKWAEKKHAVNVMELLEEFFSFFSKSHNGKIICTHLGKIVPTSSLVGKTSSHELAEHFKFFSKDEVSFSNGFLNVQDPIELSFNCTAHLEETMCKLFKKKCSEAVIKCRQIREKKSCLKDLLCSQVALTSLIHSKFELPDDVASTRLPVTDFVKPFEGKNPLERLYNLVYCIFSYSLLLKPMEVSVDDKNASSTKPEDSPQSISDTATEVEMNMLVEKDMCESRARLKDELSDRKCETLFEIERELTELVSPHAREFSPPYLLQIKIMKSDTSGYDLTVSADIPKEWVASYKKLNQILYMIVSRATAVRPPYAKYGPKLLRSTR